MISVRCLISANSRRDAYKREKKSLYKKDKEDKKPNHDKRKASTKLFLKDLEKIIIYKNKQGIKKGYREYLIYLAQERMLWSGYSEREDLEKISSIKSDVS